MNIVTSLRMKEIDRISIEERGFGDLILMENAGIRILEEAEKIVKPDKISTILCLAGTGNNGGDALVIARQIFSKYSNPVNIIITGESGTDAFNFHLNLCRNLGISILEYEDLTKNQIEQLFDKADIVFDGISGTGIRGGLREPAATLASMVRAEVVIAIDVPSGIGESFESGFTAVKADYTLTVGLPKRCLYKPAARPLCGEIRTVSIGFPEDLKTSNECSFEGRLWELVGKQKINELMPVLKPDDYKNSRGRLAVFAGSPGTTGAASLCAEASARTAAGLVSLFADEDIFPILASKHRSVMVKKLSGGSSTGAAAAAADYDALAVGPGWGRKERRESLHSLLEAGRGVLDADGINVLSDIVTETGNYPDLGGQWVLTPHAGEFRRLFPEIDPLADPFRAAAKAADILNCVIMLKGAVTVVAGPRNSGLGAVIDGCFPKLGTAGSGDILCGLAGGYLASGLDAFDATVLSALVHLEAGVRCAAEREWFSADDLLEYL